ncbi:hypothetical protein WR25_07319 [Diploscapter pachys]|uniref:Uncharacterized protein n=1 Tax=Diploscapter pachys TaxID=2018661 RepID=A0A2A2M4G5_9BILA|nr:hypothetical protein WR25_07319 [Diploscapter pachys]
MRFSLTIEAASAAQRLKEDAHLHHLVRFERGRGWPFAIADLGVTILEEGDDAPHQRDHRRQHRRDQQNDEEGVHATYLSIVRDKANGKPPGAQAFGKGASVLARLPQIGERGGAVALGEPRAVRAGQQRVVAIERRRQRSTPRTTSVTPCAASSTVTAR